MRLKGDQGVTIVEAAFVLPLLFFFVLTMVDLGQWAFQTSQTSSAARDGARVGIIDYQNADVTGSASQQKIVDAVRARFNGAPAGMTVTVQCVRPDDETALTPNGCGSVIVGCDRILVRVNWTRNAISPFGGTAFGSSNVTGSSAMVITGAPRAPSGGTASPPTTTNSLCSR